MLSPAYLIVESFIKRGEIISNRAVLNARALVEPPLLEASGRARRVGASRALSPRERKCAV